MSKYVLAAVCVTDEESAANDDFLDSPEVIGFTIVDTTFLQVVAASLYAPDDLHDARSRLQELEEAANLKEHWPDARDPEVLALLADQTFQVAPDEKWNTYGPMARYQKVCETVARKRLTSATADTN